MSDRTAKRLPSLINPMAMPATCAFIGTPASISARRAAAHPRHRARSVRLGDLGHHAHRVAELLRRGQHVHQRALGQTAMADLAALGRAHPPGLAGGVRRHVVVEHEALRVLALQRVDDLLVARRAQRRDHQRLRFAAGEQRRAVRSRQHAGANGDGAYGARVASVDARFAAENAAPHDLGFQIAEQRGHQVLVGRRPPRW